MLFCADGQARRPAGIPKEVCWLGFDIALPHFQMHKVFNFIKPYVNIKSHSDHMNLILCEIDRDCRMNE